MADPKGLLLQFAMKHAYRGISGRVKGMSGKLPRVAGKSSFQPPTCCATACWTSWQMHICEAQSLLHLFSSNSAGRI